MERLRVISDLNFNVIENIPERRLGSPTIDDKSLAIVGFTMFTEQLLGSPEGVNV